MTVAGLIMAVAGGGLFFVSLARTVLANPDTRVPFNRNPQVLPTSTVVTRSVGMGLLVAAAAALTPAIGFWSVAILLACPVVALAVIVVHNHRVALISRS